MIYDGGADDWSPEDIQSVLEPVEAVSESLSAYGHDVSRIPVLPDLMWLDAVRESDLVFNLCEGIGGVSHLEYKVASAIELCGIPYTGGHAWTMTLCHRKPLLNTVLEAAGLPVPPWHVPENGATAPGFPLPAIVKPAAEDASVGIDQGSVVTTSDALERRVNELRKRFPEIVIQRYIHGRELAVGIVGDTVLPISEIDFSDMPDGAWPILSFDAKWKPGSPEDVGSQPVCPAALTPDLQERVATMALQAWQAVDGTGYGRVDLRVDHDHNPWIIEVNPNPDISTDAGLARMAAAAGWHYDELVRRVVDAVMEADGVTASTPGSREGQT